MVSQSTDCSRYAEPRRFDVALTGSIHFEEADNRRIAHEGLSLRRQDQRPSVALTLEDCSIPPSGWMEAPV